MTAPLVWAVVGATILLILIRPRNLPEAVWACGGAVILLAGRLVSPRDALAAVVGGLDVYLFLAGMMGLAELARREGLFDWLAAIAVNHARGAPRRLFALVYLVGTVVTIFLSNDATAVVLTPAVLAAVRKARATPLPYLFICAFIANAASFVLPISNPANLVMYGSNMPPLASWLRMFALPSLMSIGVTFLALRFGCRKDLSSGIASVVDPVVLSAAGRRAAFGLVAAALALLLASAFDLRLGWPTLAAAVAATVMVAWADPQAPRAVLRDISWSVLPLVAALFVMVAALNQTGARAIGYALLQHAEQLGPVAGSLSTAFGVALLSNVANNLPVGLIAGGAVHAGPVSSAVRSAVLIGVDLGPNLSVTGSLATILWLMALRRDGVEVGFLAFLRIGLLVMPPALALAVLASLLTGR